MTPRQLLGQARVKTFDYVPYLASYIYSLRERESPGIGTAAVDSSGNLYWDPEFIAKIGVEQGAYLVTHEVLHLIFDHHGRSKDMFNGKPNPQQQFVLNIAADLVIEQTLSSMRHLRPEGCVHLGCEVPSLGIKLDFPANCSMPEYYRLIMEKLKGQDQEQQQQGQSQGDGTQQSDDGNAKSDDSSGNGSDGQQTGEQDQKPGSPGAGGSCADGVPRKYEDQDDGTWEAYGQDIAAAGVERYEESNPGSVPDNIKQAISGRLRPQPDPFDQLRSAVSTSVASPVGGRSFSRRRISRRQQPGDDKPLLAGLVSTQPNAVVIVDTSGSMMTPDIQARALSVIGKGLRKLGRVRVYCADTKLQSNKIVSSTKLFDWQGGGGTDMSAAIEQVDAEQKPDSIILVTDAETYWSGRRTRARVVVAYTGEKNSHWHNAIPSWMRVVPLKEGA